MKTRLTNKIDQMREKLYKLIELYGPLNQEVLRCSQELDNLIYNTYENKEQIA
ncbi:MAG: Spo0E like sporulation regulatory protein [Clostridia bacterium]|nr:Spo0E like sporulation regulatory protein [Clostridia bacterium]